jgi:hypothetical protein
MCSTKHVSKDIYGKHANEFLGRHNNWNLLILEKGRLSESITNISSLNKVLRYSDNYLENENIEDIQYISAIILSKFILVITIQVWRGLSK